MNVKYFQALLIIVLFLARFGGNHALPVFGNDGYFVLVGTHDAINLVWISIGGYLILTMAAIIGIILGEEIPWKIVRRRIFILRLLNALMFILIHV